MNLKHQKIPTILLTGFLGAGKTTLLNRLIEHYQSCRTVLLINEFGKIGIDGELLIAGNYEKIELNKGSLFCICIRTDFIYEVEKIAREIKPDLLIIEATGLADTSEMEKMLALPNLIDKIKLELCICLVDCQNFIKIKDNLKAPGSQIRSADLVLVNKCDLVSAERVEQTIQAVREFSAQVPIFRSTFGEFPLEKIKEFIHPNLNPIELPGEGRPDLVVSTTLEKTGFFSQDSWNNFKNFLNSNFMRLKGFVTIGENCYHLDATTDSYSLLPTSKITPGTNRIVIIGENLDEDAVEKIFLQAIQD